MMGPEGFIEFTKKVIFRDWYGKVTHIYEVGDRLPFTAKTEHYFVCTPGGIYFDEAKEVAQ